MSPDDAEKRVSRLAKALGVLIAARAAIRAAGSHQNRTPPTPEESQAPGSDVDPSKRTVPSSPRAEGLVALLLLLAAVFGFAFTVIYIVLSGDTQLLGVAMGGALLLLAAACIVAGKFVVPQETAVEERGPLLVEKRTEEVVEMIEAGGEGISRRAMLLGAGGAASAALLTAAATPLVSLGPTAHILHESPWARGVRLVDMEGQPYPADEIQIGSFYTALPEGKDFESFGAGLLVVRLPAEFVHLPAARRDWAPSGILGYSKICTHAGCAISLYRYPTYAPTSQQPAFTCPCHYSTFLPGEGGRVVFGPAGRALPQLPLMIDSQGYLRAASGFHEDIGTSWWGVHRAES
ncbi:MAG: ubiquinol-cytochrome c reductase iron-sulfur subunit [Solirubrobacteraceae bacterium]